MNVKSRKDGVRVFCLLLMVLVKIIVSWNVFCLRFFIICLWFIERYDVIGLIFI